MVQTDREPTQCMVTPHYERVVGGGTTTVTLSWLETYRGTTYRITVLLCYLWCTDRALHVWFSSVMYAVV